MQHKCGFVRRVSQRSSLGLSGNIWPGGYMNILLHRFTGWAVKSDIFISSLMPQLPLLTSLFFFLLHVKYKRLSFPFHAFLLRHPHPPSSPSSPPPPLTNPLSSIWSAGKQRRLHNVIFKFQEMVFIGFQLFLFSFLFFWGGGLCFFWYLQQQQEIKMIHNEDGRFAFSGKRKIKLVLCVFCESLMNYWFNFLTWCQHHSFRILVCCCLPNTAALFRFFMFFVCVLL